MTTQINNAAKFAFFYLLSLVALIALAMSSGMVIFQIINKNIIDVINQFSSNYSPSALKYAISALVISAPIYYLTMRQIFKNLATGALTKDSGVRRWLTYFILLVTSVVMISWLIATLNSFLGGELTTKFILKAMTAILIAATIFTFYFYEIKREEVQGKTDKIILAYCYGSLAIVLIVFVASLFFMESPTETRNRKLDNAILDKFERLDGAIQTYYQDKGVLPDDLVALLADYSYLTNDDLKDPAINMAFDYKIISQNNYQLCSNFRMSNKDKNIEENTYYQERWPHDAGYQCLKQTARTVSEVKVKPVVPAP